MTNDLLEKARKEINEADKEMARLFEARMNAVKQVAKYKIENHMPVLDPEREKQVTERGAAMVEDEELRPFYLRFIKGCMALSRDYQEKLIAALKTGTIRLITDGGSYNITVLRGGINRAGELFNLNRRVLIVTDSGVPCEYAKRVAEQCRMAKIITLPEGECSKNLNNLELICSAMADFNMTREDCVVAVGGGMVGDISCFAAASYMRGVDFYNIPTTLLSQVDSSIGGKCAVNLGGVKNIVGAFYQPCGVICDPDLLKTLPQRHISNGLAEVIKMSLTSDEELFSLLESERIEENTETIIIRSLMIKKSVVEADERECGIRKILNLGHTLGHGIEASCNGELYHGECVAIGMMAVCSDKVRERLVPLLKKYGLPTEYSGDIESAVKPIYHDKKRTGDCLSVIYVDDIGSYRIEKTEADVFCNRVREVLR